MADAPRILTKDYSIQCVPIHCATTVATIVEDTSWYLVLPLLIAEILPERDHPRLLPDVDVEVVAAAVELGQRRFPAF